MTHLRTQNAISEKLFEKSAFMDVAKNGKRPRSRWHKEDVFSPVFVAVIRVCASVFSFPVQEFLVKFFEGIGYILQEDQPRHNVLHR